MEEPHKEYSSDDSFDQNKTAAEYGNAPHKAQSDNSGNELLKETGAQGFESNSTTGSGYSEAERNFQDGINPAIIDHRGSEELVDKYNINDKAHSDSSVDDFIPTTSNYLHAEGNDTTTDSPENDSRH